MNDRIQITIEVPDPSLIREVQFTLDVDPATNDFTQNYYFAPRETQPMPGGMN